MTAFQSAEALNERLSRPTPTSLFGEIARREGFAEEQMTLLAYAKSQGWTDTANILDDLVRHCVWRLGQQYDEYEALVGYAIGRKFQEQNGSATTGNVLPVSNPSPPSPKVAIGEAPEMVEK